MILIQSKIDDDDELNHSDEASKIDEGKIELKLTKHVKLTKTRLN